MLEETKTLQTMGINWQGATPRLVRKALIRGEKGIEAPFKNVYS